MTDASYPTTNTNTARQTLESKQQSFLVLKQARASTVTKESDPNNNNNANQQTESSPATQPRRLERSESISAALDKRIGLKVIDCQLHNSTDEKYVVCSSLIVLTAKVFVLEVEDLETGTQWTILRRYTQIYNLHLKLVDLLVRQGNKLLVDVPPRRLFGRFSLEFVEKRAKMLQDYFDSLLACNGVQESDELIDFLDPSLDVEPGVSPSMWTRPDKEGLLVKQGHFVKSWKERWFILQGNLLFYFKTKPTKEMEPLGIIPLGYCTVEVCNTSQSTFSPGRKYLFEIRNTHLAGEKDYLIQAKAQTEMEDWVQALRMAKVNYMKAHFTLDEQVRRQFEDTSKLTEFSNPSKSSDKLRAYVMATQRARKVNAIASKFDILSFSHSPLSSGVAKYTVVPDSSDNILYYESLENKDISIKGGSVDKLIEKLTDPSVTDIRYIMAFLLTYRSFTTPTYLLDLLIQIFNYYSLDHRSKKGKISEPPTAENTVHIRVGLVMKKWLECHFYDFVEDLELTNKLLAFIDNMRNERRKNSAFNLKSEKHDDNNELLKTALVLKSTIKKNVFPQNKSLVSEQYLQNAPAVILPTLFNKNAFDFIDLDPLEIARQLAILEFELFHKVTPKEFLNQRWNKTDKEKEAPNIYGTTNLSKILIKAAIIKRFNQFSFWVSSVIVKVKDVKPRAAMIKKFIDIAQHSFDLNNFTSTMEICAGLESSGIFRLRKTWQVNSAFTLAHQQLLPPETTSKFESMKLALGAEKNYKAYRETLHKATGACVPYIGVYLQDLTFIEDGNPDFIKGTELVNFEKRVMVSKVISEIQQFRQDVSSFSEENFDLKSWINNALSHGKAPEETMEQHASSLVMRLQLLSVEYNNSLEEVSNQALLSVPRCVREVERAKREATELKKKLDFFVHNLSKVEKDSVESLKLLSQLDTIKIRIELCVSSLKEAQKLAIMNSPEQIESVFQTSNYSKIAAELSVLQHSLEVLKNVPEFRTHHKNLEQLQDRLEQKVRGQLIQAFNNHDLEQAQQYVDIYHKINRGPQLIQHYYKCRQLPVEQFWNSFDKTTNLAQDNPFVGWLPVFYDEINIMISKELFPKDHQVIPTLMYELMTYLSPLFKKRIETFLINPPVKTPPGTAAITYVNQYPFLNNPGTAQPAPGTPAPTQPNQGLRYLINAYEITSNFANNMKSLLASTADSAWLDKIITSTFDPYFPYQTDYANLEKKWMQKELDKLKLVKRAYIETISQIDNSATKLFLVFNEALDHCIKLTHGSEGDALLKSFSDILVEFLQHLFTILQYLRELAQLDSSVATPPPPSHSFFDWRFFQGALQLLQIVNKFTHRLNTFDRNVRTSLLQQKNTILPKNATALLTTSNPDFGHFPVLHIRSNPDKVKKLISFYHNLEDVAFKLLATPAQLLNVFASNTHSLVFDTIFHYIRDRFKTVPQLDAWKQDIPSSSSNPLNLPSFSLAPLNYITQIGEHLLTLPQHLEPFSSHDSELFFDPKGIQNLNVIFEDLKEFNITMDTSFLDTSTVITETEETLPDNNNHEISAKGLNQSNQEEEENKFASQWISAIGKGTMSLYLQKIMEIPLLKEQGSKQLATDIGYLMNVINALGIPIDTTLEIAFKYITVARDQYDYRGTDGTENKIASMISKMREIEK